MTCPSRTKQSGGCRSLGLLATLLLHVLDLVKVVYKQLGSASLPSSHDEESKVLNFMNLLRI